MKECAAVRLFGCLLFLLALVAMPLRAQDAGVPVNITTWQQDDPSVCAPPAAACVDRTGQNLQEGKLTSQFLKNNLNNFGLVCQVLPTSKYPIDGQIYAQPLIVTGVNIAGGIHTVAYVVTQNDSVYAVDATNCTVLVPPAHLLNSGQVAVDCSKVGSTNCQTIAPSIGILGTPVISANNGTGTLYAVAESQSGTPSSPTFYHTLWALDITTLSTQASVLIDPTAVAICPTGTTGTTARSDFSRLHIQRPALLLGADNFVYIAFSMMDGNTHPLPNGMVLAYNTVGLASNSTPLCLSMSGGGAWRGRRRNLAGCCGPRIRVRQHASELCLLQDRQWRLRRQ